MGEFTETKLGRLLIFANGRTSPERGDGRPFPVFGSNGIIGSAHETNSDAGSLIIGRVGSYCGSLYFAKERCWVTDNAIRANAQGGNDPRFLFYLLTTLNLNNWRAGSGQPLLNQQILSNIIVSVPPPEKQQTIASILGALDDKIDLNRRMNETLEAMARALFKNWFVDFGPTRAKMEGRELYLAPDLWALFPDRLDDEGKPEGWERSTIGDEVEVVGGSTPSTKEPSFWDGDIYWATPKDLSSLVSPVLLDTGRKISKAGLGQISSGLLPEGTVLLSSRAPIGYLAITEVPLAINQGFIAMRCEKRLPNTFVWLWTSANMEAILQNANGSTFQEISKRNFRPLTVIVPSPTTLKTFDDVVRPLYGRIASNEHESRTLAQTRDLLLPKLMSGEIRVGEALKIMEAAL